MKKTLCSVLLILFIVSQNIYSQYTMPEVLALRERVEVQDKLLNERMELVLPEIMSRENVDMWVIINREYNEDPVIETMYSGTRLHVSRRTILVFYDPGNGSEIEKYSVGKSGFSSMFQRLWYDDASKGTEADQFNRLVKLIEEKDPQSIALNISRNFRHADGLSYNEYRTFKSYLPEKFWKKIVEKENLAVGWLETRTPAEIILYEQICRIAHIIIAEGLSEKVIQPGVTTTDDVRWWYRERIAGLKLEPWFHPTVDIQRSDEVINSIPFYIDKTIENRVILPGDLIHIDLGITYMRLNTDTQELAYVLKAGETDAPEYLKKALATGNRLQDILATKIKEGKSGNQILKEALDEAKSEGIDGSIYCHPVGFHGHAAGGVIGMWDKQEGVPGTGDYPFYYNTVYAIELNVKVVIPEWNNKLIMIGLEEEGLFTKNGIHYIDGRQKGLILIPGNVSHLRQ